MQIWWLLCEIRDCLTDLRVGALDVDGLQINMEADYKGVPSFRAALQLMGCDGQCGGTAHRLQKAQASLLSQQCVHTELTQANRPWEGITWWEKREERLKTKHTHTHTKSTVFIQNPNCWSWQPCYMVYSIKVCGEDDGAVCSLNEASSRINRFLTGFY